MENYFQTIESSFTFNPEKFNIEFINGLFVCSIKDKILNETEMLMKDYNYSKIQKCILKKNSRVLFKTENISYRKLLIKLWCQLPINQLLRVTTYNMKLTNEKGFNGYVWCDKLNLSIQDKQANLAVREIINITKSCGFCIELQILLATNEVVHFKDL